jgi:hypothetical protein
MNLRDQIILRNDTPEEFEFVAVNTLDMTNAFDDEVKAVWDF